MKTAVLALLLLPFVLSALLPQGFMPSMKAEGGFTVTLCTTDGLKTVTLDANGVEILPGSDEEPENGAQEHCVFAGVGSFLGIDRAPDVQRPALVSQQTLPTRTALWLPSPVFGQNGARAPPHGV